MIISVLIAYIVIIIQYTNGNMTDVVFIATTIMTSVLAILFEIISDIRETKRLREMLVGSLANFILDEDGNLKSEYKK